MEPSFFTSMHNDWSPTPNAIQPAPSEEPREDWYDICIEWMYDDPKYQEPLRSVTLFERCPDDMRCKEYTDHEGDGFIRCEDPPLWPKSRRAMPLPQPPPPPPPPAGGDSARQGPSRYGYGSIVPGSRGQQSGRNSHRGGPVQGFHGFHFGRARHVPITIAVPTDVADAVVTAIVLGKAERPALWALEFGVIRGHSG